MSEVARLVIAAPIGTVQSYYMGAVTGRGQKMRESMGRHARRRGRQSRRATYTAVYTPRLYQRKVSAADDLLQ